MTNQDNKPDRILKRIRLGREAIYVCVAISFMTIPFQWLTDYRSIANTVQLVAAGIACAIAVVVLRYYLRANREEGQRNVPPSNKDFN